MAGEDFVLTGVVSGAVAAIVTGVMNLSLSRFNADRQRGHELIRLEHPQYIGLMRKVAEIVRRLTFANDKELTQADFDWAVRKLHETEEDLILLAHEQKALDFWTDFYQAVYSYVREYSPGMTNQTPLTAKQVQTRLNLTECSTMLFAGIRRAMRSL